MREIWLRRQKTKTAEWLTSNPDWTLFCDRARACVCQLFLKQQFPMAGGFDGQTGTSSPFRLKDYRGATGLHFSGHRVERTQTKLRTSGSDVAKSDLKHQTPPPRCDWLEPASLLRVHSTPPRRTRHQSRVCESEHTLAGETTAPPAWPPARPLTEEKNTFHLNLSVTKGNAERSDRLFASAHAVQKVRVARQR